MLYRNRSLGRWFWRFLFSSAVVAWMSYIFHLSSLTYEEVRSGGALPLDSASSVSSGMSSLDAHLLLYAVLAALALGTLQTYKKSAGNSLTWVLSAATFATLYGLTDEFHQSFVAGRSASGFDVLWDGMGALVAAIILGYLISNWAKLWATLSQTAHLR